MPTDDAGPVDDLPELLRQVAARLDALTPYAPADDPGLAELRRRFVAASGAARRDPALARRRLSALAADLDARALGSPSDP